MGAPQPHAEVSISSTATLPLWQTIGQAYSGWFSHFADVVRVAWFWIILLAMTTGAADWLKWSMSVSAVESFKVGVLEDPGLRIVASGALYVVSAVLLIVASIDISFAWHRRVILREAPQPIGSNVGEIAFWRYFSKLFVLVTIGGGPIALFLIMTEITAESEVDPVDPISFDPLAMGTAFLILLAALAIFSRLCLVLPSSAASDVGLTFKRSWILTRGNTWRLTIGLFVCAILPMLPIDILLSLFGLVDSQISPAEMLASKVVPRGMIDGAVGRQISIVCEMLTLPIGVGFLSHCYQHAIRQR